MFGTEVRERADEIGQQLAELCGELDPTTVPLTDTPAVFDQLVAIQKLAEGAVLRMTARYEEAGRWKTNGSKSFEDDLARRTGTSRGKAKQRAKTSRRLQKCPKTDAAVRDGKLSQDQADLVSSGADASPDDEDGLLESAGRDPICELKKKAAAARARADRDRDATRRRQHKLRSWRQWIDEDGMSNHLLRLPPDKAAEIDAKLTIDIDRAFSDARHAGRLEPRDAYAADVVFDLLTGRRTSHYTETPPDNDNSTGGTEPGGADATAGQHDSSTNSQPPAPNRAGKPTRDGGESEPSGLDGERLPKRSNNQAVRPDRKVIALIDVAALNRGSVEGDETCEIAGVGPVSVPVIRAMLSDAFLAIVIKDGVDIINVTHLGRQVTAHQRTALEARGYKCEVEGCGATHHLEMDHIDGYTLTRTTRIEDLAWLCDPDHDKKTRENLILKGPPGRRKLVRRDEASQAASDTDASAQTTLEL